MSREPHDLNLHVDGWRARSVIEGGRLKVEVRLMVNGKPSPETPGRVLSDLPDTPFNRARQMRQLQLAVACCDFLNTDGDSTELFETADRVAALGAIEMPYDLVAVLPGSGPVVIWKKPDGSYLKVVEGEEGFVDPLTEDELENSLYLERREREARHETM